MSRIIVKNLPKHCTEKQLRQHFKQFEPISDVSLKFTKEGVFRKFAFVGFEKTEDGQQAIENFNQTYLGTSRMIIETCLPIAEKNKVRPWSKHTKGSSAYKRLHGDDSVLNEDGTAPKRARAPGMESKYMSDPLFNEFLRVRGAEVAKENEETAEEEPTQVLLDAVSNFKGETELSLIFRGLPVNLKQTNLKEWLSPIRLKFVQLMRSSNETFAFATFNRPTDLRKALQRTDQFLGGYKVRICKFPSEKTETVAEKAETLVEFDSDAERKRLEAEVLETGRLFLRNLPFTSTERELVEHFQCFGEIVDCQCVIDKKTGRCKGIAMVQFIQAESALKAYRDLDGTVFKGRMLHILPGKEKPAESTEQHGEYQPSLSTFQRQSEAERKLEANKPSHSWNTLFMGTNAIAETLTEKLQVGKAEFLAGDEVNSAGVRMSLAETRLVNETRAFLEQNGVVLDAFANPNVQRSDTVIIAKNLPAGIDRDELLARFRRYGEVKRFLLPPECKVTALVEMENRVDAKRAFEGLTYSRLHSQPLYLEWAPMNVFREKPKTADACETKIGLTEPTATTSEGAKTEDEKQHTKILIRNIPFQASVKEVQALFVAFGELKSIRLPKKAGGQSGHRGFGFVDFVLAANARAAFDSLSHSTHLYNRRLVLEWSKSEEDADEIRAKKKRDLSNMQRKSMSKKQIREAIQSYKADAKQSDDEDD